MKRKRGCWKLRSRKVTNKLGSKAIAKEFLAVKAGSISLDKEREAPAPL